MEHKLVFLLSLIFSFLLESCNSSTPKQDHEITIDTVSTAEIRSTENDKPLVEEKTDTAIHIQKVKIKKNCFIVISKKDLRLSVYESREGDTVLIADYPCCLSKNKGNKQAKGDMRTPESPKGKPFKITQIQDASDWHHDFKDGRGSILAYGHWFLRLLTPGHSGIGIHGSTNNENTVPGRASEGCIRLLDKDIIDLHDRYAYEGMPVIIKSEDEGLLSFELKTKSQN